MHVRYFPWADVAVFCASMVLFGAILFGNMYTDIQLHAIHIQEVLSGAHPPPNFMYFLTVYAVALSYTDTLSLHISSMMVLSFAVMAKFSLTRVYSARYFNERPTGATVPRSAVIIFSLLLLIVFSLPTSTSYLGQISPNVWHNSTTIFVMPFALLLFWQSYKQLQSPTVAGAVLISIFCVLNAFAKPSFLFVFCGSYPLMLLSRFGLSWQFWKNLLPVAVGVIATAIIYFLIYELSFGNRYTSESYIVIWPFRVWEYFSNNIPLSFICSNIFPLAYIGFYGKDCIQYPLMKYALISYVISVIIFIVFAEIGPRLFHGNFYWQCVICSYILFHVTLLHFIEKVIDLGMRNWKNIIIAAAFSSHVIAGFLYLGKFLLTKNYYH